MAFLTYQEGVDAFRLSDRLSDGDRATLMGGTLQKGLQLGAVAAWPLDVMSPG